MHRFKFCGKLIPSPSFEQGFCRKYVGSEEQCGQVIGLAFHLQRFPVPVPPYFVKVSMARLKSHYPSIFGTGSLDFHSCLLSGAIKAPQSASFLVSLGFSTQHTYSQCRRCAGFPISTNAGIIDRLIPRMEPYPEVRDSDLRGLILFEAFKPLFCRSSRSRLIFSFLLNSQPT